jgi:putative transferase (TIGR04331 family)
MNSDVRPKEISLATTAREEFWEADKPMVFLGEWCRLYVRRAHWEQLDSKLLSSPYDRTDAIEDSYRKINQLYEQVLPLLGAALNSIHGRNHSSRYWRILIGPWLQSYLLVVYDRYVHIKHALDQYPQFTTIGLSEKSFIVPTDTLDYFCSLLEDTYNLQLFTKILKALGREFPCKETEVSRNPLYAKLLGNSWKRKALGYVVRMYAEAGAKLFKSVLLRNSYFPKTVELELIGKNFGRLLPSWSKSVSCPRFENDNEKRNKLRAVHIGAGEFERCVSEMLYSDMPQCFVEGYDAVGQAALKNYPRRTNAIFSANAWYNDEHFKQWAALSADDGAMLLGIQHGGIYGALGVMPSEDHETSIVDRYYTWGWDRADCKAKVIPIPASKLMGKKVIGADNNKEEVLWVATSVPRYADIFQLFYPQYFSEYLAWQKQFAKALPKDMLPEIRFRPHYENYSWGTVERLQEYIPDIRVESWKVPFQSSLDNCRLYVCDHLSTTFTEALASNKPTILFWNPATNKLRPEAQPYFNLLKNAGILFETPEAAAAAVADIYKDVETWWNAPERQQAVQAFCEKFARKSPNAMSIWSDEFKKITQLASRK